MHLRFRQLQVFHAIIEPRPVTGTVTGAPSVLGISQPAILSLLNPLEQQARYPVLTPALLEGGPFIVMGPDPMTRRRTC